MNLHYTLNIFKISTSTNIIYFKHLLKPVPTNMFRPTLHMLQAGAPRRPPGGPHQRRCEVEAILVHSVAAQAFRFHLSCQVRQCGAPPVVTWRGRPWTSLGSDD